MKTSTQISCTAIAFLAISLGTTASAAPITWTQGDFTNDSVLNLAGPASSEVYGIDFTSSLTTANGYSFENANYSSDFNSSYNGFLSGGGSTGDTNFNTILTNATYTFSPPQTLTLENLTVGTTYNVLTLDVDTRSGNNGCYYSVSDGITETGTQTYGFNGGGTAVGGYFLGTFTANSSTQEIESFIANPNTDTTGGQFNAILVEVVPEPSTYTMMLGGLALMALARFRLKMRFH